MKDQQQLLITMTLSAWESNIKRTDKAFDSLSDQQLSHEISPNRNSGIYLLGHLVAVHDAIPVLLGTGPKMYPQLEAPFITSPDKSGQSFPATKDLRVYWKEVNARIAGQISKWSPEDWLSKHTAVSLEDFAKEPHRNRLNIIINRTNHLSYHLGQLILLTGKNE